MSEKMKDANGYEIYPLSFKLFENNKKEKDSQPDYTGKFFDQDGKEYFLSAWLNETKKGSQYLSGKAIDADEARAKWGKEQDSRNKKIDKESIVTSSGTQADDDLPF
jgi:hypothetical protein